MIGKVKEEPRRREGHWGGVNEENWQGATPSPMEKKKPLSVKEICLSVI